MWHVVHFTVRLFEALLGFFCVGTATLLYPGEDGKIQSRLEDLWVKVDEFRSIAVSKFAAFMARVARLETNLLELLFGKRLFSEQALLVSFSLSFVSTTYASYLIDKAYDALAEALGGSVSPHRTLQQGLYNHRYLVALAFLGIAIGILAIALRTSKPFVRRGVLAVTFALIVVTGYFGNEASTLVVLVPVAILGFVCDALFIAATRSLLGWAGSMKSALKIIVLIIVDISLALLLFCPYFLQYNQRLGAYFVEKRYYELPDFIAIGLAYSNVLDVALATAFFMLCFLLLLHMTFWPILTRTLFRIQEVGTKGRRGILTTVGLALLGTSVFGGKFPELLAKVIEKLGG